jgi:hypothetical protein
VIDDGNATRMQTPIVFRSSVSRDGGFTCGQRAKMSAIRQHYVSGKAESVMEARRVEARQAENKGLL